MSMLYVSMLQLKCNEKCSVSYCNNVACSKYFVLSNSNLQVFVYARCLQHNRHFCDDDLLVHPKFLLKILRKDYVKFIYNGVKSVKEIELLVNQKNKILEVS